MSEDTKIRFLFSKETIGKRLKYNDLKMIRKVKPGREINDEDLERLQVLACRFMADDAGNYLPLDQAFKIFGELSLEESVDAINKFTAVFQENTIPNGNGKLLNSTLEAASQTQTSSLNGSE